MPSTANRFERYSRVTLVAFVVLLLAGILAATELFLRWKNAGLPHYRTGVERAIVLREHKPLTVQEMPATVVFGEGFVAHPSRETVLVRVDGNGFILPSGPHADPRASIVFLGGSTTECLLNSETARFPYLAGRRLEERTGWKINTYNGGRSGNNSLHSINALLNKVVPMAPDMVVMMHNINDLVMLLVEKSYWNLGTKRAPVITLKRTLGIEDYAVRGLEKTVPEIVFQVRRWKAARKEIQPIRKEMRPNGRKSVSVDRVRLRAAFEANLKTFVCICRHHGIVPVLMTQPNRLVENPDAEVIALTRPLELQYGLDYARFKELIGLFNDTIRDTARTQGVALIDLERHVPKERRYIFDLIHFTDPGSALVASEIARQLAPALEPAAPAQ